MKHHIVVGWALLGLVIGAAADEFAGEDLSLRLPAAFSRFSPYADVAAKGGASAAGMFGSAENPASTAWSFPQQYEDGLSVQYSHLGFEQGTELHVISESIALDARRLGVFRFSFGNILSNDEQIRNSPLVFRYEVKAARLDWARRLGAWSLGASYGLTKSETSFRVAPVEIANAERLTSLGRLGLLWQPRPRWLGGLVAEYGYAPTETTFQTPTPFGLLRTRTDDPMRELVLRPGVSFEWQPNALLQLDYEYARFWNETGVLERHRFLAGGDFPLARFLFLRAGASMDGRGNFSWSAGLGFYPHHGLALDFAYQNDNFPELEREFGHSRTLNGSVSVQF